MPHTTYLHVQSRGQPAARVLELAENSVRIGRGPQCEVRLDHDGLAEVQCLLRRRGESWHVQPVGPAGWLSIDGRPIEGQRVLPAGVSLRIADSWLTLRHTGEPLVSLGSFETPITVESRPPRDVEVRASAAPPPARETTGPTAAAPDPTRPGPAFDAERERLRRWEEHLERRDRGLKARQVHQRWRAAGETLRARAAGPDRPEPSVRPAPVATPPVPRPEPPPRPAAEARPRPDLFRPADLTRPEPVDPPAARAEPVPLDPEVRDFRARWNGEPPAGPPGPTIEVELTAPPVATPIDEADAPILIPIHPAFREPAPAAPEPAEPEPTPEVEAAEEEPEPEIEAAEEAPAEAPAVAAPEEPVPPPRPDFSRFDPSWAGAVPFVTDTRVDAPAWQPAGIEPAPVAAPEEHWPAASRILEGVGPRPATSPKAKAQARRQAARRPVPTAGRAPAQWALPLWLGGLPTAAAAAVLGAAGLGLAWTWGQDDRAADLIADRVLGPASLPAGPIVAPGEIPEGAAWWQSTAGHLQLRALAAGRAAGDPDADEQARFLLGQARAAAPLEPSVRYALARQPNDGAPAAWGPSRDVVALTWSGRQRLDAGRADAALEDFRAALELAAGVGLDRAGEPTFDDDPQVRRFRLPGEDVAAPIVRAMADHADWAFDRWSTALPPSPVVALAAYRALRERGSPDADRARDRLLAEESRSNEGPLALAAQAEALAFAERWDEADARYRKAIEAMPAGLVRRSWWLNVATIASRRGDDRARDDALERARGPRTGDPVNRRAAEAQTRAGLGAARPRSKDDAPPTPRF